MADNNNNNNNGNNNSRAFEDSLRQLLRERDVDTRRHNNDPWGRVRKTYDERTSELLKSLQKELEDLKNFNKEAKEKIKKDPQHHCQQVVTTQALIDESRRNHSLPFCPLHL